MKKLFAFVMVGSNDLNKSAKFYDSVFIPLEIKKVKTTDKYVCYAQKNSPDEIEFYVTKPNNKEVATYGNGTMITGAELHRASYTATNRGKEDKDYKYYW
jgi:hypothetical protein